MMEEKTFVLDEDAKSLYEQLEGIEFGRLTTLGQALSKEERKLNACRGLLGKLAHLLGACLKDTHLMKDAKTTKGFLNELLAVLHGLGRMPGHDGKILIRYRGLLAGTKASERIDYVVLFGNILFDIASAAAMVKSLEDGPTDLQTRLTRAFQVFSDHGISSLYLQIPGESSSYSDAMQVAVHILSCYIQSVKPGSSAVFEKTSFEKSFPLIHDERDQPDLNLTLLAGVNGANPKTMKTLVKKVDTWMRRPNYVVSEEQFQSVYNAILGIKTLREKLVHPPIEVNNIKWLIVDNEGEFVSKQKSEVARLVAGEYGNSPQEMARVIGSVYGDDFQQIDPQNLGERLRLASNLLTSIEKTDTSQPVMDEILDNVESRLDKVSDHVYDNLEVHDGVIKAKAGETETTVGRIHSKLKTMVGFFKARSAIKKKMRNMAQRGISFDAYDYKIIAKDFRISVNEAEELIDLFKSCFDDQGCFIRVTFERNTPELAKYGNKVFMFLWQYLKVMLQREDRIAFLNALQLLVVRLKEPEGILSALLSDFFDDPTTVTFSDQCALVLLTLFASKHDKEFRKYIEITPEEVLKISKGLDTKMVAAASKLIDSNHEKFFEKVKLIHRELTQALDSGRTKGEQMHLRDMFFLEREVYIFLSLVGGNTARALIRSAAQVYGDPKGKIYLLKESKRFFPNLLQLLRIVSRGLGRMGGGEDLNLLEKIRTQKEKFLEGIGGERHKKYVELTMKWVEASMQRLAARN
jgi:hypothetical protein